MEVNLNQAIGMLKNEEARMQELEVRLNQLFSVLTELRIARATLQNLPEEETETLLPIGAGILLPSKASKKKRVFINVGANVVLEKEIDEAIEFLDSRIEMINKSINQLSEIAGRTSKNIEILKKKISEALKRRQGPTVVG